MFLASAVYLLPTTLFWTSGMLKESLAVLGLSGLIHTFFRKDVAWNWKNWLWLFLFGALLINAKMYLFAILFPGLLAHAWSALHRDGKSAYRFLVTYALAIACLFQLSSYLGFSPTEMMIRKQEEFKCLAEWMNAGSTIHLPDLDNSWSSFVLATPRALYNSLLRPMPWDGLNVLTTLSMLEVFAILCLFVLSILFREREGQDLKTFTLTTLYFSLFLALLIGWTTPVLGAIVRYRMPIYLVLVPLTVAFIDWNGVEDLIKRKTS